MQWLKNCGKVSGALMRESGAQTACRWGWDADFCTPPMRKARSALRSKYRLPKIAKCKESHFPTENGFLCSNGFRQAFFSIETYSFVTTRVVLMHRLNFSGQPEISPIGSYTFYNVFLFAVKHICRIRYDTIHFAS